MTEPNLHYPGRPNYVGPKAGIMGLCHHNILAEPTSDCMERVQAVRATKPLHEQAVRLWCMVMLDSTGQPWAAANKEVDTTRQKWAAAYQEWDAARQELAAARQEVDTTRQKWAAAYQEWVAAGQKWDAARQEVAAANQKWDAATQKWDAANKEVDAANKEVDAAYQELAAANQKWVAALRKYRPQIEAQIRVLIPDLDKYWDGKQLIYTAEVPA